MKFDLKKQWPLLGIPWTLLWLILMLPELISWGTNGESPFYFFVPFISLLVVFSLTRVGAIVGFVVLTIASLAALQLHWSDSADWSMGIGFFILLVGGPISLFVGLVEKLARRAMSKEG